MKKQLKNKKGFTSLEIVIVIALIVIFVFVGGVLYINPAEKANETACELTRSRISDAVTGAKLNKNTEVSPAPIDELEMIFLDNTFFEGYLENPQDITCPNGGIYSYSIRANEVYCTFHFPAV